MVNNFGLCIRGIWGSFPHVGKPVKTARPFIRPSMGFGTGEA